MARENQWAYTAQVVRCHAKAAMERENDRYTGQEGADSSGIMTRLVAGPTGRYGEE